MALVRQHKTAVFRLQFRYEYIVHRLKVFTEVNSMMWQWFSVFTPFVLFYSLSPLLLFCPPTLCLFTPLTVKTTPKVVNLPTLRITDVDHCQ